MKQIKIGVITNTHGLRGEVKVKCLSDFPQLRFQKGASVNAQQPQGIKTLEIEQVRTAKDLLIVKFCEYDNIAQVEGMKGTLLSIDETSVQELDDDEAYFFEMQDSEVYELDGRYLGKVTEVLETGANAILRVSDGTQEVLIPFVKAFVKEFDKKNKIMKVELMEGLL